RRRSCGGRIAGTASAVWYTPSVSHRAVDTPYNRARCMRTAVSTPGGDGPRTVELTRVRPAGARDGSTRLTTHGSAPGRPRSAASGSEVPVPGASSTLWRATVTGWEAGTRSPGSNSAADRDPVAISTAPHRNSPCSAVVTEVVDTE